ncbi:hypothetical protein AAAC51_21540 [Priestia megaterium]
MNQLTKAEQEVFALAIDDLSTLEIQDISFSIHKCFITGEIFM